MGNKTVCLNCDNRHMGCHSECEDYLRWRAERDEDIAIRNRRQQAIDAIYDSAKRRCDSKRAHNGLNEYRASKRREKKHG